MGWYFRKSVNFGPFRMNFSKSGVGLSTGVRGARISTGPRGTYITLGRHGVYYRQKLSPAPAHRSPQVHHQQQTENLDFREITTATADALIDLSATTLLEHMNQTYRKTSWSRVCLMTGMIGFFVGLAASPILVLSILLLLAAFPLYFVDKKRKTIMLHYDLQDSTSPAYEAVKQAMKALTQCSNVWKVDAAAITKDRKRHAGAGTIVRRTPVRILSKVPFIESNVQIYSIKTGKQTLCFAPDHLFVFENRKVGAVSFDDLQVETSTTPFIEDGQVPKDGRQVGTTWRYVNKNGTPDRRFSNNKQLPVMQYGELMLTSSRGMRLLFHTSRPEAPQQLAVSVSSMAASVQ